MESFNGDVVFIQQRMLQNIILHIYKIDAFKDTLSNDCTF